MLPSTPDCAGFDDEELEALRRGDDSRKPPAVKAALEFARKMTVDSAGVTDGEFAALVQEYGEKKTAAMVLLMAYANFQDRLLLCLGSPLETGGPKPPLEVAFSAGAFRSKPADPLASPMFPFEPSTGKPRVESDPEWASLTYEQLQVRLQGQEAKGDPAARAKLGGGPARAAAGLHEAEPRRLELGRPRLRTRVSSRLGDPDASQRAETNSNLDRIFGVNLFWVTTRTINCPYCMGHTEMLWELGGLNQSQIARVCQVLAGNDWSSFPPAEQRALAFARKVTKTPWSVSAEEIQSLKHDFGPVRAAAIIWWECRGNYMTRVANGFQLSLERDDVLRQYLRNPAARAKRNSGPAGR